MKRFLILMLAFILCMACLVSCGLPEDAKDDNEPVQNSGAQTTPTQDKSDNSNDGEDVTPVPGSKTITEEDFEITLYADNTAFSLEDVKNGDVTDLNYKVKIKYIGSDAFVVARCAKFSTFNIIDSNGNAPFGITEQIARFTNVQIEPGFEVEEAFAGSYQLSKMENADDYVVRCSVYFTTVSYYFSEEYQDGEQTCHPSDEQLKEYGKNYRFSIELPLTIFE